MHHRLSGLSTYGLNGLDREMSTPPTLRRGTAHFTFTFTLFQSYCPQFFLQTDSYEKRTISEMTSYVKWDMKHHIRLRQFMCIVCFIALPIPN